MFDTALVQLNNHIHPIQILFLLFFETEFRFYY